MFYISFSFTSVQRVLSSEMKTMFVRGTYIQTTVCFRVIVPFISIYLSERENQRGKKGTFPSFHSYEKIYSSCMKLESSGSLQPEGSTPKTEKGY